VTAGQGGAAVYDGARPRRAGDLAQLEAAGMAPVPEAARYGGPARVFAPWFAGNMELSALFLGTIAPSLGLGFAPGAAAIAIGIALGAAAVAWLCTWGPRTGCAQLPLARMPFGRAIVVPGAIQWASATGWIAIGCLFGAQALQILLGVPFMAAAAIVTAAVAVIAVWGYELVMQAEKWGALVMTAVFAVLTTRILSRHAPLPVTTVHGPALAAAFAVMVAVALSGSFSWASYGSDYSRYLRAGSSPVRVAGFTTAGMCLSYGWLAVAGLAAASVLGDQTAGGARSLMGGGAAGDAVLAAICLAAVISSSMNAYSGSLSLQALGVRARRPAVAAVTAAAALALVWWMQAGSLDARVTNVLLLTGYWLSPFLGVVAVDWLRNRASYTPGYLAGALAWPRLGPGWAALAAFAAGLAAMAPFAATALFTGPAARAMHGADLAYYAGFAVTAALYAALTRRGARPAPALSPAGAGTSASG
jgi:NCS1 family nucleobase:cation symporter-1